MSAKARRTAFAAWVLAAWLPLVAGAHDAPHAPSPAAVPVATPVAVAAPPPVLAGRELVVAAAPGAAAPRLVRAGEELVLSWLEPAAEGGTSLRLARLGAAGTFAAPQTVVVGADLVTSAVDPPVFAVAPDGAWVATWTRRLPAGGEATAIEVARSTDQGGTWRRLGPLHDDTTATEHGFVAMVAEGEALRAVWLDGRETASGGATALRIATLGADAVTAGGVLDDRVCDCCPTAAVAVDGRPLVLYRDRSREEMRDIAVATAINADVWRRSTLAVDDWKIAGCPVNGPAAAVAGETVWAAWYTEGAGRSRRAGAGATGAVTAQSGPRVRLAVSHDGGHSFESPVELPATRPLGRVDLVAFRDGAVLAWLEQDGEERRVLLARVGADGALGTVVAGPSGVAGTPRLAARGEEVLLAWQEPGTPSRLRVTAYTLP